MSPRAALLAVCWVLAAPLGAAAGAASLDARAILDRVDDLFRGRTSHGRATMAVVTAHWARTLGLEFWSRGEEETLVRILAPQKEKDTATLRVGNDVWNYLPKVKRVVKLPSSMMSASWMGSHFTNDDLVKESRMTEDYTFTVSFDGEREGRAVVEVTCVPREDAPVEWGRVVVLVRRPDWLPLRVTYYDETLRPARIMTYEDVHPLGGRVLPTVLRVVPTDEPAESTVVTWEAIEFDVPLPDDTFSLRNLER